MKWVRASWCARAAKKLGWIFSKNTTVCVSTYFINYIDGVCTLLKQLTNTSSEACVGEKSFSYFWSFSCLHFLEGRGAAAHGGFEILHVQQQFQEILLAPDQDGTKQDFQKITSNHNRVQCFSNFRNNKKAKTKKPLVIIQSFEKHNPQILHLAMSLTSYSSCCSHCLFSSQSGLGSPTSRSSCSTLMLTKLLLGWASWKRHNRSCVTIY